MARLYRLDRGFLFNGHETGMNQPVEKEGVWFVYDGECPLCRSAAQALRISQSLGPLHLINARKSHDNALVKDISLKGYDLDEGMVIYYHGEYFHGKNALKFMARHGSAENAFNAFSKILFWSDHVSNLTYPWLRGARNLLLKQRNIGRIDNLGLKDEPIFKPVFGASWDDLPPVMKKHYANRPYTNDVVTVEGHLDVMSKGPVALLAPLLWLLRLVPPANETRVPVTVNFRSAPDTKEFQFDRIFHFKDKPPYHFRSRMLRIIGNEVIEIMRFGLCWRMLYLWDGTRVLLQHKGYALNILGHFLPLPVTFLIGRGDAEEIPVSDDIFEMSVKVSHPLWGNFYEYKGPFKVVSP